MAGLPASLCIAMWFVGALWVVGALAYWLEYDAELIWVTAAIGSAFALAEWRAVKKQQPGGNHD